MVTQPINSVKKNPTIHPIEDDITMIPLKELLFSGVMGESPYSVR
jgi:hypothetical protein